jgi:lipopolysaccharide export LptBFGC system permease protein LptF
MSFLRSIISWLPIRILDRYLARQVLISTFIAVAVLSVILVLGSVFRVLADGLTSGLVSLHQIPGLIWDSFGYSLSFTVPWGILTSVLLVFGRLSADNELTTMRMSGLGLGRICLPVFLVAGLLSLLCFWVNVKIAPEAYKSLKVQKYSIAMDQPEKMFEPQKVISDIPGYVMYAEDREGAKLKGFWAMLLAAEGGEVPAPMAFIMAKTVDITPHKGEKSIDLDLRDVVVIKHEFKLIDDPKDPNPDPDPAKRRKVPGPLQILTPGQQDFLPKGVDLSEFWRKANRPRVDGMTLRELRELYTDASVDPSGQKGPTNQVLQEYMDSLKSDADRKKLRSEAITEYNSRYSFSFACLTLGLVGICFGIAAQRRETSAGFVLSLVVGILYFAFIMLGNLWKDKPQYYPQYWVWLPNVLFGAIGLFLFWRHQRR